MRTFFQLVILFISHPFAFIRILLFNSSVGAEHLSYSRVVNVTARSFDETGRHAAHRSGHKKVRASDCSEALPLAYIRPATVISIMARAS